MNGTAASRIFEYICEDCHVDELELTIIPKKKCPHCGLLLDVIEMEGIA